MRRCALPGLLVEPREGHTQSCLLSEQPFIVRRKAERDIHLAFRPRQHTQGLFRSNRAGIHPVEHRVNILHDNIEKAHERRLKTLVAIERDPQRTHGRHRDQREQPH